MRIPDSPPKIYPRKETLRPRWSVMIPAYNCVEFIARAIEGVLKQDQGEENMQIEVVDDASTDGDLEAIVKELGRGRVGYFRQRENCGSLRNFETCLQRSKGYYIHLLHGDDVVLDGYYQEMEMLFDRFPEIGSAFCSNTFINRMGEVTRTAGKLMENPGIIPDWQDKISTIVYCQPPAVSVKREVYEKLGGFYGGHFGEDWEMWCRIAAHYSVAYSPKCLAQYRSHPNNISARYHLSGKSLEDIVKFIGIIQGYLPEAKRKQLTYASIKNFSNYFTAVASTNIYADRRKYLGLAFRSFLKEPSRIRTYFLTRLVIGYVFSFNTNLRKRIKNIKSHSFHQGN